MGGRDQGHPVNFCSVCGLAFQSNHALVDHISFQHNPYNATPYNPHFIRATQQQIANDTIDYMFQNPKKNRMNIQHQGERTAYQHNQDNPMNRAVTIETQNPHLQTLPEMHMKYSNTAYSPSMNLHTRNDHQNVHTSPRGYVAASTGQFHPTSEYQQEMSQIGRNLQVPCNPIQYHPTTNPEMQNNTFEDGSELRYLLIHNGGRVIGNPMQHNSYQNTYSAYTEAQRTNLVGNAIQPQRRAALGSCQKFRANLNIIKNIPGGIVMYRCKRCGLEFYKQTDATKHRNEHHKDIGIGERVIQTISNFTHSKQNYAPIPELGRVEFQQRNTGLYLPQAPPTICITIDDDEPEQHNSSTFENRANKHPQQNQQHNSLNERNEVKNTNKLSIRTPTAVNNLICESQHKKTNEEDGNISNAINNFEEIRNIYSSDPKSFERNISHLFSESIASNEDDRWKNTNNNKIHPNSPHWNMHEFQNLHNNKRFKLSNVTSSIDNDASKINDGQNNNTIKAHENEQKTLENKNKRFEFCSQTVTPNADDASKYSSDAAKFQQNKSEGKSSSKTNKCSDSESSREDDASDGDIIDENKTTQKESKTKKQMQSSSLRGECLKFNFSDFPINQSTMLNMAKSFMKELFLPTSNNTKEKSKYKPKQKLFKCRTCPKHFVEEKQLHKHLEKKCRNRRGKICNKCKLEFSKKSLKKHIKEHHENEKNLTLEDFDIVTGFSSTSSDSSESSTASNSSERSESVSPNSNLKSHKPITSGGRQVKQSNGHKNPESLNDDLILHTSVENERKIPTSNDENRNANSSHSSYNFVVLKCAKCERCFYQVNFERHKEVCGKSKIKKCELCPLKFSTISLKRHKKEHHSTTTSNTIRLIISENNNIRHETLILAKHKLQKASAGSKFLTKITKTQKGKFVIPSKLRQTVYKSYSRTIFQCGICNTCFATAPTLRSHFNNNNHAMSTVEKCSICNLLFSEVSLKRHHNYHHRYLKLNKNTDFIIKVRDVKTRMAKNILNSKKSFVSSVNNKTSIADPKENTSSPSKKKRKGTIAIIQYGRETDQSQKRVEHKDLTPEIPKNNSNQDQIITEMDLIDVDTLYTCLQCDLYFMENRYFQNHLAANHKLLIEPLFCTFCKRKFCVSLDSFRLHMALEFENKPINNLIIKNPPVKTIQNSCNDFDDGRNNVQLKECVVKLTNIQSSLVSTTSTIQNSGLEINLKEALGSTMYTEYFDSSVPRLTATADHKDSQLSEELGNKTYVSDNRNYHENKPHMIIDSRTENIQQLESYALVETTAVSENDDLFTTENLTNKHSEIRELDYENGIQERVYDKIENDAKAEVRNTVNMSNSSQKSIKILSNIVLKHPTRKDDQQPEFCNKTQSKDLLKDNAVDKDCVLVSSTDTNQVYDTKDQSPLILGNSNIIKDGDENVSDLYEKCEVNFEKLHSIHESAKNIITESNRINENFSTESETVDSSDSLSILASSHMTESGSKPKHCYQNKPTFNFDAVGNVENDPKNEEVVKVGPKFNKDISKSTEDLIKLLEDDLTQETTKPDEEQQNCKFETLLNENMFVTNDTVTDTEHNNVVVATNQPEIGITKSNLDIKSSTSTEGLESSESNETYIIDKVLIDISENDPEIVTIEDDEPDQNEQVNETISPFIDDLYEINTENNSNDVNQRKLDRKPIKIKLPSLKFINLELPQPDEVIIELDNELDNVITSSTHTTHTCKESVQTDNVTTTVVNYNDDFKRDVENIIANINKKEPKDDATVSSSSSVRYNFS